MLEVTKVEEYTLLKTEHHTLKSIYLLSLIIHSVCKNVIIALYDSLCMQKANFISPQTSVRFS